MLSLTPTIIRKLINLDIAECSAMFYTISKTIGDYAEMDKESKFIRHCQIMRMFIMCITWLIGTTLMIGCAKHTTQFGVSDCVVCNTSNSEYTLTIIANQEKIQDKEAFAKQLIEQVRNNDFKTILFSYDEVGYPTRLDMTVYLNEDDWQNHISVMCVSLTQQNILDNFNIVENLDKFEMKIQD